MSRYLAIRVPQPCHENWDQMLPRQGGKFCLSCQKKVHDFSNMTDAELVAFFQKNTRGICGRFQAGQLNRDLLIPKKPMPWIRYFFQFTLPAFLFSLKAGSQQTKESPEIVVRASQKRPETPMQAEESAITIKGSILDQEGSGIPFATIILKGSKSGVLSDRDGNFTFPDIPRRSILVISSVGFEAREIIVEKESPTEKLNVSMQPVVSGLVGEVVVYSTSKKNKKKSETRQQAKAPGIVVYPNPVVSLSVLKIKCTDINDGPYIVNIINPAGISFQSEIIMKEKKVQELSLQLKKIPDGIYFIRLVHRKTGKAFTNEIFIQ